MDYSYPKNATSRINYYQDGGELIISDVKREEYDDLVSDIEDEHPSILKNKREMSVDTDEKLKQKMMENISYPSPSKKNFQEDIYQKREFYIYRIPYREPIPESERLEKYREKCTGDNFKLSDTQNLLSNFINPNTPYRGLLLYHGTGTGKTCAAIAIAEKFKPMVEKYGTPIYVLVHGPLNKQSFLRELFKCTGETYLQTYQDRTVVLDDYQKAKNQKNAMMIATQYYRILSYRSFYKKVLGEKIKEKVIVGNKVKSLSKKTDTGEYEREISIDRIYSLDNTVLIVDEAHNLTSNGYGLAVKKIMENSKNLRLLLLSATPMKNFADDMVELINFMRPKDSQMHRDKIFTSPRSPYMEFKPGGEEYLRKHISGYISYLRGADPLTFAERHDMGEIPPGLSFTKLTRCYMLPFQYDAYKRVVETENDSLDRISEEVANFVFPGIPKNNEKGVYAYHGIKGINELKYQIKNNKKNLNNRIASTILSDYKIDDVDSLLYLRDNNKRITGDIFNEKYLELFSTKFYTALKNINDQVYGKKGNGLIFTYSNLVRVGIDLFQEVLHQNGYIEYQENVMDAVRDDTKCYFCGYTKKNHSKIPNDIPKHKYHPATYIAIVGKSEENPDQIPEVKHQLIDNVFNSAENKDGKYIKVLLGSVVMNEGITLRNIKEINILDVHYNLGRVDQVIGRGIRFCTHYNIISDINLYPKVDIYKYVIADHDGLTTEEQLYQKAELKYMLIKKTERIFQEEAIDCPLNISGNIFPEELKKYGNCGSKENPCPAICGYMPCQFKCADKQLNLKYYDPEKHIYKKISNAKLDYSTYNNSLVGKEIEYAKSIIKEMYRINHIYSLDDIVKYVKKSFPVEKMDMFDDYYVYQGLDDLVPITSNDFNNFHDTVIDKFNRQGYLIYRNKYYIFQPFDENDELPMYYRRTYKPQMINNVELKEYVDNILKDEKHEFASKSQLVKKYDFNSVQDYYDKRNEFEYVGIIDKKSSNKTTNQKIENKDQFKIRQKRPKILDKKRETGIPSFTGAVCYTSKDKEELMDIVKLLNLEVDKSTIRSSICEEIRDKLFALEKYSTSRDKNKKTYLIIPGNHPEYPFPLNLEDRIKSILNDIKYETRISIKPVIKTEKIKGRFSDIKYLKYQIIFDSSMDKYADLLKQHGAKKENNKWVITVE